MLKRDSRASLRIANGDEGKGTEEKQKRSRRDEEEEEDARITGSRSAFSFQRTKRSFSGPSPRHIAPLSLSLSPLFSASSLSLPPPFLSPSLSISREEEMFHGETLFHPIQSLCLHRAEVDGPLTQFFKWIADAARVPRALLSPRSLFLSLPLSFPFLFFPFSLSLSSSVLVR